MAIKIQIMTDLLDKEYYISRCLELAARGGRRVRPNPHVGCVIVHNGEIIGEGYHEYYGGNHAEVNAVNSYDVPVHIIYDASTTGVENSIVEDMMGISKRVIDGQLYIIRDGKIYTAMGVQVK